MNQKFLVYITAAIIGLVVLIALIPGEDNCTDPAEFAVWLDNSMMQTGAFKSVNSLCYKDTLEITVEPSVAGLSDPFAAKEIIYNAASQTPACMGLDAVEITLIGPEYDTVLQYPMSSAMNGTEDADLKKSIKQH
jgi:hypothetical protein